MAWYKTVIQHFLEVLFYERVMDMSWLSQATVVTVRTVDYNSHIIALSSSRRRVVWRIYQCESNIVFEAGASPYEEYLLQMESFSLFKSIK